MPSVIYFIEDSHGLVKIGTTRNIVRRLESLKTSAGHALTLIGTIPGSVSEERDWHERFFPLRRMGEWFEGTQELRAAIHEALAGAGPFQDDETQIDRDIEDDDLSTREARDWVIYLRTGEARRLGVPLADATRPTAALIGISPGTVSSLARGRIVSVSADHYFLIRAAVIAAKEEELAELKRSVDDMRAMKPAKLDEEMDAIDAVLRAARSRLDDLKK